MSSENVIVSALVAAVVAYVVIAIAIRRDLPALVIPNANGVDNPR